MNIEWLEIISVQILLMREMEGRAIGGTAGERGKWDCLLGTIPLELKICCLYVNKKRRRKDEVGKYSKKNEIA